MPSDQSPNALEQPEWADHSPTDERDGRPDTAIVPYVNILRERGVDTYQSCSGHVYEYDEETLREDGTLWFDAPVDVDALVESGEFSRVQRMHHPEDCWEVIFPGMAQGPSALASAMAALFAALEVYDVE